LLTILHNIIYWPLIDQNQEKNKCNARIQVNDTGFAFLVAVDDFVLQGIGAANVATARR
jgi:hypothetical protein